MDPAELDKLNDLLEIESELREKIQEQTKELNKKARLVASVLDRIHTTPSTSVNLLLESTKPTLESCRTYLATLVSLVPPNQLYRYNGIWANALRSLVFSASLSTYLRDGSLMTIDQLDEIFGVQAEGKDRFCITTEDYLHGVISMVNELSRLCVNSVTMGEFDRPLQIASFVKDVFSGFTMLNLKNDSLRRRFDSLKYDLKKIEEVVYDVSLRKLAPQHRTGQGQQGAE